VYGATGSFELSGIRGYVTQGAAGGQVSLLLYVGMLMLLIGMLFKVSAAPFHFWTPDVYEGAPPPVTAFLSVASKAGSFALLVRFFLAVFPGTLIMDGQTIQSFWLTLAAVLAVISMLLGNIIALAQKNIKRLLAYSSIAQAGYVLIGVAALPHTFGHLYIVVVGAQPNVLPAIVDVPNGRLYLSNDRVSGAQVTWVQNATKYACSTPSDALCKRSGSPGR